MKVTSRGVILVGGVLLLVLPVFSCASAEAVASRAGRGAAAQDIQLGVTGRLERLEGARAVGFDYIELATSEIALLSEEEFQAAWRRIREVGCLSGDEQLHSGRHQRDGSGDRPRAVDGVCAPGLRLCRAAGGRAHRLRQRWCTAGTRGFPQAREAAEQASQAEPQAAVPAAKAQRNFTDPESRILLDSTKAFVQGYNAQVAVDHESQVIVATEVLQAATDKGQLVPMVLHVVDNLEEVPEAISADAGYWAEDEIETLAYYEILAYVASGKIRHRQWRAQHVVPAPLPEDLSTRERMRQLLRTERGRAEYDKRKITAEPVLGQIKGARGFRQFLLRGLKKVQAE